MTSAEELCLSCGLCCDGSLFWAVPIKRGEEAPAPLDADGKLRQPCACFNGACTIYASRPAACRTFDCRVLQTVQAGRRDIAWAREQIAGMRRVLAALDAVLPGSEPSLYRRAAEFLAAHQKELRDPAFQRKHRNVLRHLAAYEAALARFHVARQGKK
jgi:Fe-S-cluster containining protein